MKPETQKQILGLAAMSVPFVLVEVRGAKAETINYTSGKTGRAESFSRVNYTCEGLGESAYSLSVSVKPQEGVTANPQGKCINKQGEIVPFEFKKGDKVIVLFNRMTDDKGVKSCQAIQIVHAPMA